MQKSIPGNHQVVMPYLVVENADAFTRFLKEVFSGKEVARHFRPEDESKIMHAEVLIGDSTLMLADSTDQFAPTAAGMFIYVDDVDFTYKLALEKGAASITPPADQPYGRSGGVMDAFGNTWWITSPL